HCIAGFLLFHSLSSSQCSTAAHSRRRTRVQNFNWLASHAEGVNIRGVTQSSVITHWPRLKSIEGSVIASPYHELVSRVVEEAHRWLAIMISAHPNVIVGW